MAVQHMSSGTAEASARDSLTIRGLEVMYSNAIVALSGVSLDVPAGRVVSVLGANGAGKTTLVRAITGLLSHHDGRVRDGDIRFGGETALGTTTGRLVRSGICQVPEGRMLFPRLSVEENLQCGAAIRKDKAGVRGDLERMYDLFPQLASRRRQTAGYLSGGEQQMVAIARALMARPKLLVCDELSLGLAPIIVADLFEMLGKLNKEDGLSILVIEQNARVALRNSHYGYVLETGRIVAEGSAEDLQEDEFVQEFYLGGAGEATAVYERIAARHGARRRA